jgi:hypothetical protein
MSVSCCLENQSKYEELDEMRVYVSCINLVVTFSEFGVEEREGERRVLRLLWVEIGIGSGRVVVLYVDRGECFKTRGK